MAVGPDDNYCAVIGNPIAHSLSPLIHQEFAAQSHMPLIYERLQATEETFAETVREFFAAGGRGLNVTSPFKQMAFMLCDETSPMSQAAQSCNTLYQKDGKIVGTTTDGEGWLEDVIRRGFDFAGKSILLVGAGGANRILYHTLLDNLDSLNPASIVWANRSMDKLLDQPDHRLVIKVPLDQIPAMAYDLVVNGISVGLQNQYPDLALSIAPTAMAYDLNYGDAAKPFHDWAVTSGALEHNCVDGWGMLVGQAAKSFEIWWQKKPEITQLIEKRI